MNRNKLKELLEEMRSVEKDTPVNFVYYEEGQKEWTIVSNVEKVIELIQNALKGEGETFSFLDYKRMESKYDIRSRDFLITLSN